jgi:transposase
MKKPSLMLTHPDASRERLLALARKIPGAYIGIKIAALLLILEGQRPGWVSRVLGLTRQSLNVWMHNVNERGLMSLKPMPKPGRPGRLTPELQQELDRQLEKSPLEVGLNRARWDGPTLVVYLKRQFGIKLKVRQAQYWMHQLGYRLKRASYSYLQARAEEAKGFRKALKKTSLPEAEGNDGVRG